MWKQEKKEAMSSNEQEGKKVTTVTTPHTSSGADEAGDISAFIGKGVEFKGTISFSGTLSIDGYLEGEIHTDGLLLIGKDAVIQAKINAGTIVSKGKITGEVVVKESIKLRAPAVMNGNVKAPLLSMEDGVIFNGTLEMAQGVREVPRDAPLRPVGMIMPPSLERATG